MLRLEPWIKPCGAGLRVEALGYCLLLAGKGAIIKTPQKIINSGVLFGCLIHICSVGKK